MANVQVIEIPNPLNFKYRVYIRYAMIYNPKIIRCKEIAMSDIQDQGEPEYVKIAKTAQQHFADFIARGGTLRIENNNITLTAANGAEMPSNNDIIEAGIIPSGADGCRVESRGSNGERVVISGKRKDITEVGQRLRRLAVAKDTLCATEEIRHRPARDEGLES